MKTATRPVAVFVCARIQIRPQLQKPLRPELTRRLWRPEPLSIFGRCQEGLNHLCAIKIAVKLIELGQPEIVTRVV